MRVVILAAALLGGCSCAAEMQAPDDAGRDAGAPERADVGESGDSGPPPAPASPQAPIVFDPYPFDTRGMSAVQRGNLRLEACWVARVGINENSLPIRMLDVGPPGRLGTGGVPTDDVWGILQVAVNTTYRSDKGYFLEGLKRHASHVTRVRKVTRHRQEWTGELPCRGAEMPPSWRDQHAVKPHRRVDGDWRIAAMLWPKYRKAVIGHIMRGEAPEACPGKPRKWGNRKDICHSRNYGWCILPCGDLNYFLARPGQGCELTPETNPMSYCENGPVEMTLPASVAAGRRL